MTNESVSASQVIQKLLRDATIGGIATAANWPVFYGSLPATPDNVIVVYDTTPIQEGKSKRTGVEDQHEGIQIRVRGKTNSIARNMAMQIQNHLTALDREEVSVTAEDSSVHDFLFLNYTVVTGPTFLSIDDEQNNRKSYVLNGIVTIEEDS